MDTNREPPTPRVVRNWTNIIFLAVTPLVAAIACGFYLWRGGIAAPTLALSVAMALATGLSITAGYHRLFSHKTYHAHWVVRAVLLAFGAASFQNSARKWCSDHRVHHQHTDHERDPYNIQKGLWHAHIGWIFWREVPVPSYANVADLMQDPLVRWQHRYYYPIAVAIGFVFPALLAWSWGDFWGGLWIAGVTRVVVNHHLTFAINSFAHYVGRQPYSDKNSARDCWWLALFTYGEGYHNFHHAFPSDYRNGVRAWQFDPAKWLIFLLAQLGLAAGLRRIPHARMLQLRVRMEQQRALAQLAHAPCTVRERAEALLASARTQLETAHARMCSLREEYRTLKKTRAAEFEQALAEWRLQLIDARHRFRMTREEWRTALAQWRVLCAHIVHAPTLVPSGS